MAVMVTMTLPIDTPTYQGMHAQLLPVALEHGVLFHSAHAVGDQVRVIDFWPSAEVWNGFLNGPMVEGMKAAGLSLPDDVEITEVLSATGG
jgi:hypothetical protein